MKEHPSYGFAQMSRVNGSRRNLFMSGVTSQNTVRLRIGRAKADSNYGQDKHYATTDEIIEVEFSASQFAEFITTLNVGNGVPCTITHINREPTEDPPEDKLETEKVREHFKERMQEIGEKISRQQDEVEKILAKKTVGKTDRETIKGIYRTIKQEFYSNMPFALEQYDESADKLTAQAKAEVDAFISHAVNTLGLKELKNMNGQKLLGDEKIQD